METMPLITRMLFSHLPLADRKSQFDLAIDDLDLIYNFDQINR